MDNALLPALRAALRANEIGSSSPYVLSYAKFGRSGASFGMFQADTNVDPAARDTLRNVLNAAQVDAATSNRIVSLLSQALPNGSPLSTAEEQLCNAALDSPAGRQLVDQMDDQTLGVVVGEVDTCLSAAQTRQLQISGEAQLCIGLWVNMTGAPRTLSSWLAGHPVGQLSPPSGPTVTKDDLLAYLHQTKYFILHPRNLAHFMDSVAQGAKLLPQSAPVAPAALSVANASFPQRVRDVAYDQWRFFGGQTYSRAGQVEKVGSKEGDDGFYQRVGLYWLEGTGTHGLDGRDHSWPWSAAFISWVMKTAGAGTRFRYSTMHSVYVSQAIRDRRDGRSDAGFWGFRLGELQPRVGDLVCWSRQDGIDYDHQNDGAYKGHCDIIVEVRETEIDVIGGNVGDSVTKRPLALDANGFILAAVQGGETLFAILQSRIP